MRAGAALGRLGAVTPDEPRPDAPRDPSAGPRHYVGLDLAWGRTRPTGIAVLDEGGRLVHVGAAVGDDAILAMIGPYVEGACVVAVDAPLVVRNPTGNRPAEAELNRDFRAYDAGAHPTNTGRPEFDPPRGGTLAARLGLDLDPRSTSPRRAIEVYPHPATIALFGLERTLKYKHKTGRAFSLLRSELLRLVELVESLEDASPALHLGAPWDALRRSVEAAERKSELRRAEDQVDAVLCAYLALYADRRPDDVTVYGDPTTGAIVTPTLRRRAITATPVEPSPLTPAGAALGRYVEALPHLRMATVAMVAAVTDLLDDAGVDYLSVTGRAKTLTSFASKAAREVDGVPLYADPLAEITDQLGVRVVTYVRDDVSAVVDLLGDLLPILDDRDLGRETASEGRFGYASRHLLLDLPDEPPYDGVPCGRASVQVRTVLQHAWAEFEHDIRYKGTVPEADVPDLDRRFTLAAGLLELADREFSAIRDRIPAVAEPADDASGDPRIGGRELATFLTTRFPDAGWSRSDHYAWLAGLLLELGVTSLEELGVLLDSVDHAALDRHLGYRKPSRAVRRVDDALLALFGEQYVALTGNDRRRAQLRERLARMVG